MLDIIHWLGNDGIRLDGSTTVYIDPWKLPPGQPQAGVIFVTHDHHDHFSPVDIEAIGGRDTVIAGPPCVIDQVEGFRTVKLVAGETSKIMDVTVTAVPAYNLTKFRAPGMPYHPRESGYLGYVITMDDTRYYHAGDTDMVPEMGEVACDVALLPVGGTYTMTADEAAEACSLISAREAIPMHYGAVAGSLRDAERFRDLCSVPVTILPLEER